RHRSPVAALVRRGRDLHGQRDRDRLRAAPRGARMNARLIASLAAGALFGAGLALSGMTDPGLVLAFLDVAGDFDPTLAFVLGGAVAVTVPGFRLVLRRRKPLLAERFHLPDNRRIDLRLAA